MRSDKHDDLVRVFNFKPKKEYSIESEDDYFSIVYTFAYNDAFKRAKGAKNKNAKEALLWLSKKLYDYIINNQDAKSQEEYDNWFITVSNDFLLKLNNCKGFTNFKYGKSQKIINMSMKYLYCFPDSQKYKNKFTFCHMPVDGYILEWFIKYVVPVTNDRKISITKIRNSSWSNLDIGQSREENYSYLWIQNQICKYLKSRNNHEYLNVNNEPLSPLLAEFYICPEIQLETNIDNLKQMLIGSLITYKCPNLKMKLKEIRDIIDSFIKKQ